MPPFKMELKPLSLNYPNQNPCRQLLSTRSTILLGSILIVTVFYLLSSLPRLPSSSHLESEFNVPHLRHSSGGGHARHKHEKTFYEIALSTQTTKVGAPDLDWKYGRYECLYEEALAPYRHRPGIKILELGLGCDMWYGPGASHTLWATYFDDADIYFLEYDRKCGERWLATLKGKKKPKMIYCSQDDAKALRKMVRDHGPWDVIVDDCTHVPKSQLASLVELFEALRPGGTYFIEDIGLAPGFRNSTPESRATINFIADLYAQSILRQGLGKTLEKISCCDSVCGMQSVDPKVRHPPLNI